MNDKTASSEHSLNSAGMTSARAGESFISKTEVAARLGMTPRTIEHWMRRGVIPYLKIGKGRRATVLFKWTDIEAHLKASYGVGTN